MSFRRCVSAPRTLALRALGLRLALILLAVGLAAPPAAAQHWPYPLGKADAEDEAAAVRVFRVAGPVYESESPWDLFSSDSAVIFPVLLAQIDRQSRRPEVKTLVFRLGSASLGLAQTEELAAAIARARERGKRTIVHFESAANADLLAATAADEIHLTPEGSLFLTGLRAEVAFYRELLGTLGVTADLEAVGRYKSGAESMTRDDMSDAAREQLDALLDSIYDTFLGRLATRRKQTRDAMTDLIDVGLFTAEAAQKERLVDQLSYWRDLVDQLAARHGARPVLAFPIVEEAPDIGSFFGLIEMLTKTDTPPETGRPRVALLVAEGPIVSGRASPDFMSDARVIASDDFLDALAAIEDDPAVKALVVRVNSPGGSALASDVIWRALSRVNKTRPVVVSMGDIAASGGYYIASAATRIFALDTTITGSIGVFGGKLVYGELLDKVGVSTVVLSRGKHAGLLSPLSRFSDSERAVFRENMQHTYETFVNRVRAGRNMSYDAVHRVAQGRVWTGKQARAVGLVDEVGGLHEALAEAARLARLDLAETDVVAFPRQRSFFDLFSGEPNRLLAPRLELRQLLARLPGPLGDHLGRVATLLDTLLSKELSLALMPFTISVR